ncbi:peptidoglycan-binding protein [Roseovarius pelagicus]|uniref:Peptidoglycan-binding protein n=1 Tax=Roseovarius pelagicus TaxID=2980108 RepID=A0ABY6D8K0_9RHOB|nr:peptidoglycan-binding protein [Roseovarius pelagicus]UXX82264.1 peptidoglycan-binding protein [Roseovarius pelagicus]
MQVFGKVWVALALLLACSGMAAADNVALIYGDRGQSLLMQNPQETPTTAFTSELARADFRVIEPRRRDAASMREAAQEVETLLATGKVDRLLVVVYGPFAQNARDSWALSNDSIGASSITIGATGLSVTALSDMAERSGRGVVMLVPGQSTPNLGSGLFPGLGEITSVGGVTYITGNARALARVLRDDLLDGSTSFADIADDAPSGVEVAGFISPGIGFMGETEGPDAAQLMQAGYWQAIRDVDTVEAYRLYLRAYPKAANRSVAEERITFLQGEPERLAREAEDALNLSRTAKKGIQRDLKLLGFYDRGIDGQLGRGSRAAIAAWQRNSGFEETSYLTGNQLFSLRNQAKEKQAALDAEAAEQKKLEERKDRAYWRQTGKDGSEAGLRAYLKRYPQGLFSDEARTKLSEIEDARQSEEERAERQAWQAAKAGDTPDHYRAFLATYPNGKFARRARARLNELENAEASQGAIAQAAAEERNVASSRVTRLMIEQRLEQVGAQPGSVDGQFDGNTRNALRWYQDTRDLPVTGYVSRATLMRLLAGQ